ncbi:glycosyltransferase involved in cell wall biosynthesis [Bradyrhizobium sp. BR13661]|jgi:glycosyltransferase involved in cell wall biosynthesis|nr:glycosyltransferase involved in cell wall biosynthesis [Bradyrhizobium sp. BR13661]
MSREPLVACTIRSVWVRLCERIEHDMGDFPVQHRKQTTISVALLEKSRRDAARNLARMSYRGAALHFLRFFLSLLGRRFSNGIAKLLPTNTSELLFDKFAVVLSVFAGSPSTSPGASSVLIVSHDLSTSGAPKIVYEMARILIAADHNVTVVSPLDGPFRPLLQQAGATVVIDSEALEGSALVKNIASAADLAICNTIVTHSVVKLIGSLLPTFWYLHEISLVRDLLDRDPDVRATLHSAKQIWAGSEPSAELVRRYRSDVDVLGYGLEQIVGHARPLPTKNSRLNVAVFGSFEPRKGQDLALEAISALTTHYRSQLRVKFFGRILFKDFYQDLVKRAAVLPEVELHGELAQDAYASELLAADAILVSSRDDTLPLVSLDALGSGRILLCTRTTGTSSFITHGVSGFIADSADAASIATVLREVIDHRSMWQKIGAAGQEVFLRNFSRAAFAKELISRLSLSDSYSGVAET